MKFSAILFGAALCLFSSVEATITTTSPFKSITWKGGENEEVTWADDGNLPKLVDIGSTTVDLMAGGNQSQVFVANIGNTLATDKKIGYNVPKDVGPPGDFYFIKYTAGKLTSFSGSFSIEGVNGKIKGFDPKNPNPNPIGKTADVPKTVANSTVPTPSTAPIIPPTTPSTTPSTANNPAPKAAAAANTASGVPIAPVNSGLPNSISNSGAANLFPSFAGVATAVVAFAFTYLY